MDLKACFLIPILLAALYPSQAASVADTQSGWILTWQDDFQGSAINASNWNVASNKTHCEPCEAELYVPWRAAVANGTAIITTARERTAGPSGQMFNWTSGWIDTKGKFSQLYGLFEARVKLPSQNATGIWPAFWTLPATDDCWPTQGEIDIYEYTANPLLNQIFGSYRWGTQCGDNQQVLPGAGYPALDQPAIDWSEDFHVFSVEWNATALSFYVDGNLYETKTAAEVKLPSVPQYIIFDSAIAWYWPPGPDAAYPAQHTIDWVRVYQYGSLLDSRTQ